MRIDIDDGKIQKQKYFLKSEALLKFFLGTDEKIDTLITCGTDDDIMTTDYELYEALGCLKDSEFMRNKLVKLFERIDILSQRQETGQEKRILTHERVEELRSKVLNESK